MESAVEMTRELAWKPRWAVIMLVNVCDRSTFDISIAPAVVTPRPAMPGVFCVLTPEMAEATHWLAPVRSRPDAFENVASVMRYGVVRCSVVGSMYDRPPDWSMARPVAPAGTWIATVP